MVATNRRSVCYAARAGAGTGQGGLDPSHFTSSWGGALMTVKDAHAQT